MEFAQQQREIFGPFDRGDGQQVYGDPLQLHRRLVHSLDGEPGRVLRALKADDESTRFEATEKLIDAARAVFGLLPFDPETGTGAMDRDALEVVKQFIEWREALKKNGLTTPTTQPSSPGAEISPNP